LNESLHYARGKTSGGCSARNFMVYQRGSKGSYQNWADAVGDQSYTWENFLPYFQKSVNFTPPDMNLRFANSNPEYDAEAAASNGTGPLSVTFSKYAQAFGTWAAHGFEQVGVPVFRGFLSGKLNGQSYSKFAMDAETMHRESSQTSFLTKGLENPTLKVLEYEVIWGHIDILVVAVRSLPI
jgi:choline dehydrogenase